MDVKVLAALSVAVAANMMPVMQEVRREFRAQTGADLVLTQGSSGKFAAQIRAGAPFDVFVSADMRFPKAVEEAGLADGPPALYARGTLILWSLTGADVSSLRALTSPAIKKIAVADPKLAPYGLAAIEALRKAGVYDAVEDKLVFGESISQVNQFTTSKAVEAGLTARSIVETKQWRDKGKWTAVAEDMHSPIDQGLVITKSGAERAPELTRELRAFLLGPKGRTLLAKHGFSLP